MLTNRIAFAQFWVAVRRRGTFVLCVALCTLWLGLCVSAQEPCITTFDVPASNGFGTLPVEINQEGAIAGTYYSDAGYVAHGFVRSADGKFTTFDAPGAGTVANDSNGTFSAGINQSGTVGGYLNDANLVSHGFLRTTHGEYTVFDVPGSDVNPADQAGTLVSGINGVGAVSGYYFDSKLVIHGFLRSPDGKFTSFDPPGSTLTVPVGPLNLEGAIVGYYLDSSLLFHGFVRWPNGKIDTFVGPGSCNTGTPTGCYGSGAYNINIFGTSVGAFMDDSGNFVQRGFLRRANGAITTYEPPEAGTGPYQGVIWNQVTGLNDSGALTMAYLAANNVYHGFVRSPEGKYKTFDAPGADLTPGNYDGTIPVSINQEGAITGYYVDISYAAHGFVRKP
jgi:hypothetical protein